MAYIAHSHLKRIRLASEKLLADFIHANKEKKISGKESLVDSDFLCLENFDFKAIDQTNFLLFQKLQFLAQVNILEAMRLTGLQKSTLDKIARCSAIKLSKIACSHLCNFQPVHTTRGNAAAASEDFALTYWLSVWNMASSTPFRARLCFHLKESEIVQIGQMDAAQIIEYAKEPINRQFMLGHSEALLNILLDHDDDFFRLLQLCHLLSSEEEKALFNPTDLEGGFHEAGKCTRIAHDVVDHKQISQLLHLAGVQRVDIMKYLDIGKSTCASYLKEFEGITETLSKRLNHNIRLKHFREALPASLFTMVYRRLGGNGIFSQLNVRAFVMANLITHDILEHHKLKSLYLSGYLPHGSKLFDLVQGFYNDQVNFEYCYRTRTFYLTVNENTSECRNISMQWAGQECACPFCQGFNFFVKTKIKNHEKVSDLLHSPYDPCQFDLPTEEVFKDINRVLSETKWPVIPQRINVPNHAIRTGEACADD